MTQYRHGDILVEAVETRPEGTKLGHLTLAEGEVTGHCHRITDGKAALYEDEAGTLWLDVESAKASLTHEEHKTITLPRGTYRVTRQREYAPDAIRNVAD